MSESQLSSLECAKGYASAETISQLVCRFLLVVNRSLDAALISDKILLLYRNIGLPEASSWLPHIVHRASDSFLSRGMQYW